MNNENNNQFNQNNFNNQVNNIPSNQPVNLATQQFQSNASNGFNKNQNFQQSNNQYQQVNPNTYQQPIPNPSNDFNMQSVEINPNLNGNSNSNNYGNSKKKTLKLIILISIILIVAVALIAILTPIFLKGSSSSEPVIVNSTFEKMNDYYVLKDDSGKVLLDNIKSHGKFCNGTTEITNTNGEHGIIDGSGKFVANYGKYSFIDQYHDFSGNYYCFYKVTDSSASQQSILKYDGSVLYSDSNDKSLKKASISTYSSSTKFVMFTTSDKYEILNYLGNSFASFEKNDSTSKPEIMENGDSSANDKYVAIYYGKKTYIYNLNSFKQILNTLNGKFRIEDIHTVSTTNSIAGMESKNEENSIIVLGYPDESNTSKTNTYVISNDKVMFELGTCLRAAFINGEVRCLIKNGGVYEYYDMKGNKLDN